MFWGPVPQVEVLKVGMLDVEFKCFTLQVEAGSFDFLPEFMIAGVGAMARFCLSLSYPLHYVCLFVCFICLMYRSHLIFFELLSEGIILYIVVDLVYRWEEVILGASYITILEQNYPSFSYIVY